MNVFFRLRNHRGALTLMLSVWPQPWDLTDTGEDSRLVLRRKRPKVDTLFFFRRVRAISMTQRRVEKTHIHFWTFSPVSVKHSFFKLIKNNFQIQ